MDGSSRHPASPADGPTTVAPVDKVQGKPEISLLMFKFSRSDAKYAKGQRSNLWDECQPEEKPALGFLCLPG